MSNATIYIGNYRIIKELTRGASGLVCLAQHSHLVSRIVAIKLLHTAYLRSQQERESFLQEASFLELLKHPYILPIFDVGMHEGFPYIVAEYAPNGSLTERLQAHSPGLLPAKEVLRILSQVGQALHYAHQRNIIHRDIKPANILFNANGDALLADFNIALRLDATGTQRADASGTPYYMAPEQFEGIVSKKSDQYALGCIAYELLTGHRPFTALDWHALAFKHASETPIPPTQFNQSLPPYIEQAILKALAKDRTDRHSDVAAFIAALGMSPVSQVSQTNLPTVPQMSQTNIPTVLQPSQTNISTVLSSHPSQPIVTPWQNTPTFPPAQVSFPTPSSPPREISSQVSLPTLPISSPYPGGPISSQDVAQDVNPRGDAMGSQQGVDQQNYLPTIASPMQGHGTPVQLREGSQAMVYAPAPVGTPPIAEKPAGSTNRSGLQRKWVITAAIITCVVLLVASGTLYAFSNLSKGHSDPQLFTHPTVPSSAIVTITPARKDLKNTYTILEVTGTPNASQHQVGGARILSSTVPAQTQTVQATGKGVGGSTPATQASGILTIYNYYPSTTLTYTAGTVFSNNYNTSIQMMLDASGTVPVAPNPPNALGIANIPAHVVQFGPIGNIPTVDYNTYAGFYQCNHCSSNTKGWVIENDSPFTGGQNAQNGQSYTFVQQSDMNSVTSAAATLQMTLTQKAQASLSAGLHANEQLVGSPHCTPSVSYNHKTGDRAPSVTTTVSVTCRGEAYDPQAAQSTAAALFKHDALSNSNAPYMLTGNIATSVLQVKEADAHGTVSLLVQAEATELFQFSDARKQSLAQLIVGKSEQEAQKLLLKEVGVSKVTITIPNDNGQTLPTKVNEIMINVVA